MKVARNVFRVVQASVVSMDHIYQNENFGLELGWFSYPKLYSQMVVRCNHIGHFVEVGSYKGRSAAFMAVEIINSGKQIQFDCVDPWDADNEMYDLFLENIKSVKHAINVVRAFSVDAAIMYQDESLDFVFIDANHDFKNVFADITAWFPKVRKGGVLAGHDYTQSNMKYCHVDRAVAAFFKTWDSFDVGENCFAVYV